MVIGATVQPEGRLESMISTIDLAIRFVWWGFVFVASAVLVVKMLRRGRLGGGGQLSFFSPRVRRWILGERRER
jgi:hypothetical protein